MVPRVDIMALDIETPFAEAAKQIIEVGHSRVPVFRETLDDIVGMIHIKDLLPFAVDGRVVPLAEIARKPLFVAPTMALLDLLLQMRLSRMHLAIVVDEFGGTEGLVTIEDVVEEIVGEIEDEHDEAEAGLLTALDDGVWEADARLELEDLQEAVDPRLTAEDDEVDTLGGLAFLLAGRILQPGESVCHPSGWRLESVDADARRIKRVRLHAPEGEPQAD